MGVGRIHKVVRLAVPVVAQVETLPSALELEMEIRRQRPPLKEIMAATVVVTLMVVRAAAAVRVLLEALGHLMALLQVKKVAMAAQALHHLFLEHQ